MHFHVINVLFQIISNVYLLIVGNICAPENSNEKLNIDSYADSNIFNTFEQIYFQCDFSIKNTMYLSLFQLHFFCISSAFLSHQYFLCIPSPFYLCRNYVEEMQYLCSPWIKWEKLINAHFACTDHSRTLASHSHLNKQLTKFSTMAKVISFGNYNNVQFYYSWY